MSSEASDLTRGQLDGHDRVAARAGTVVGGTYRIIRPIGSGGSGQVFEVEHLRLGTLFALKLLRVDLGGNRRAAQRFRREATAVARLRSEHIVRVIDCGELDDHTPYFVMELLDGEDLRSLLEREITLPARRAVALIQEACHALTEVHRAGLIHRDLKPENLFVCRRSNGEDWCKVLDFGVAKMEASSATAQGALVGTVRYMAPEQLADGSSVSSATDVYALGAILYECLSGQQLHVGSTIQEVMFSVLNGTPTPLGALCPSLPQELVDAIELCISKDPSERPQRAEEVTRLVEAALPCVPFKQRSDVTTQETTLTPRRALRRPTAVSLVRVATFVLPVVIATGVGVALGTRLAQRDEKRSRSDVYERASAAQEPGTKRAAPAELTSARSATHVPPARPVETAVAAPPRPQRSASAATRVPESERGQRPAAGSAAGRGKPPTGIVNLDHTNPYGD